MDALFLLMFISIYGGMGTAIGTTTYLTARSRGCADPEFPATFAGVFWPIGIWFLLSMRCIDKVKEMEGVETKRQAALKEQERKRELETQKRLGLSAAVCPRNLIHISTPANKTDDDETCPACGWVVFQVTEPELGPPPRKRELERQKKELADRLSQEARERRNREVYYKSSYYKYERYYHNTKNW